ncbi:hypothetical protein LEP1GSC170_6263 [Leptospira interrogans serovar Bataviae str. HAI135]|nr:hypothetical protein LEP1GSC170_6263 [Leptospira interrogans serovar Bataviae str. HAI135]
MLSSGSEMLSSGERSTEFNFDSKILFNLWGWLWLSTDRVLN